MKTPIVILSVSVVLFLSFTHGSAQSNVSIRVISTFDYPDPTWTIENMGKINDSGTSVGLVLSDVGAEAFAHRGNGTFTQPFTPPSGDGAQASGINNEGVICGDYFAANRSHGLQTVPLSYRRYKEAERKCERRKTPEKEHFRPAA